MKKCCPVLTLLAAMIATATCFAAGKIKAPPQRTNPPEKAEKKEDVERVDAVLARGVQDRRDAIQRLTKGIREGQPFSENAAQTLKALSKSKDPYFPSLNNLNVGEIGILRDTAWYSVRLREIEVLQIIDDENMLIEYDSYSHDKCWLKGFQTNGLVDDDRVEGLASLLKVTGTKQYRTAAGGTKTVPLLEPFGLEVPVTKDVRAKNPR